MEHAIIIGGSMAGLLAARVLADHFEQVTIVDRDQFPASGEQRRGVPQGRHTHGLLASGRRALDELFPGIPARSFDRAPWTVTSSKTLAGSSKEVASRGGRATCGVCW